MKRIKFKCINKKVIAGSLTFTLLTTLIVIGKVEAKESVDMYGVLPIKNRTIKLENFEGERLFLIDCKDALDNCKNASNKDLGGSNKNKILFERLFYNNATKKEEDNTTEKDRKRKNNLKHQGKQFTKVRK